MRRTLATIVLTLSTTLVVLPAATASPVVGSTTPVAQTGDSGRDRDPGHRALTAASSSLEGKAVSGSAVQSRPDATLALRDLFVALPQLNEADRGKAGSLLARPTDGAADPFGSGYTVRSKKKCSKVLCLHYVTSTADAPPGNAWVNKTLKTLNQVWNLEVRKLGYRPPVKDGTRGGNSKFDVYLKQLGNQGLYGYCAPEKRAPGLKWVASGFCVLDDDFSRSEFGAAPSNSMRVTAAHEFFHAVHFAYDFGEDRWMLESSATWMEERFADKVNDNRQYLPSGQVRAPGIPLDTFDINGSPQYGNWVWWEYLSSRFGNGIVKKAWNAAGAHKGGGHTYSTDALKKTLKSKGGFLKVFRSYAGSLAITSKTFAEGATWPAPSVARNIRLGTGDRKAATSTNIDHLSSRLIVLKPGKSLKGTRWMARVSINAPSRNTSPAAYLIVKKKQGGFTKKTIPLSRKGFAKVRFSFGRIKATSAVIMLTNASTRYRCRVDNPYYACQGRPRDEALKYAIQAAVYKR